MLHKSNLLIWIAVVIFCLAGIALADAVRQVLVSEDDEVLGQAILIYNIGTDITLCQVNCWNLEPDTEYAVLLFDLNDDGNIIEWVKLGEFTTNDKGVGLISAKIEGDYSDRYVVVGVEFGFGLQVLGVPTDKEHQEFKQWLDAGCPGEGPDIIFR